MQTKQIAKRLIAIAKMHGSHRDPFICADTLDQDNLYAIQEKLMDLIDELDQESAAKELPYMYKEAR